MKIELSGFTIRADDQARTLYRTADNVIDGVVIAFLDINPVKTAEKSLLRMSKVFLDGPEPMMILDLSGKIIAAKEEAVRRYGWSREEMLGQPWQMTAPKTQRKTVEDRLQSCLRGELVRDVAGPGVTKAGRELPGSITLKLLMDDHGGPDAICVLAKYSAS